MTCTVWDCHNILLRIGLCNAHYLRYRRHGSIEPRRRRNGTGTIDPDGYEMHSRSNKMIFTHREIAAAILGRPLRKDEIVHHINENTSDNNPDNLEITTRAMHAKIHAPDKPQHRPENTDTHKRCPDCLNTLLRSDFWKSRRSYDGLCVYCIDCSKQRRAKYSY